MSSEGFRGVPGVPDGWELMGFWRAKKGEHYIDGEGRVVQANSDLYAVWPIIRKIEQPARYRAFANAEEFKPHRDRWIGRSWTDRTPAARGAYKPTAYNDRGIWTSVENFETYEQMFDDGRCFDDGTPFGVKIDE
jgi:uncharacterized protein YbdZ (MbtH family)